MSRCQECQEFSVEKLETGEVVCTSCGSVVDDFVVSKPETCDTIYCFENQNTHIFRYQNIPKSVSYQKNNKKCTSVVKSCMTLIKQLGFKYQLSTDTTEEIIALFMKIYPSCKKHHLSYKSLMAASCVYHTLVTMNATVLLSEFCDILDVSEKRFTAFYNKVNSKLLDNRITVSFEEQIFAILKNFPQETCEQREEHSKLLKKTLLVLEFIRKCWLVTGRSVRICIIASAYIAWQSMNLKRQKLKYDTFKKMCSIPGSCATVRQRISEMIDVFVEAGNCLPFLNSTTIDKKNFSAYLDDIIQYQHYILDHLFPRKKAEDENEMLKFTELRRHCPRWQPPKPAEEVTVSEPDADCPDEKLIPNSDWKLYIRADEEIKNLQSIMVPKMEEDEEVD